jgi:hypothetical protein
MAQAKQQIINAFVDKASGVGPKKSALFQTDSAQACCLCEESCKDVCTMNVHVQRADSVGCEMTILWYLFLGLHALVSSLFRAAIISSLAVALLLACERINQSLCAACNPCADLAQPSRDQILWVAYRLASDSTSHAQVSNVSGR